VAAETLHCLLSGMARAPALWLLPLTFVLWSSQSRAGEDPQADPRPSTAFLGVSGKDARLAKSLSEAIVLEAYERQEPSKLLTPTEVLERLGREGRSASSCDGLYCLRRLMQRLRVDRVVSVQLSGDRSEPNARFRVLIQGSTSLVTLPVEAGSRDEFLRVAVDGFFEGLRKSTERFGRLVVKTNVRTSEVLVDGESLGKGEVDKLIPGGTHRLRVQAVGAPPYEQDVILAPGRARLVQVVLTRDQAPALYRGDPRRFDQVPVVERAPEKPFELPPILRHPGLYAGAAGVLAAGVGLILGATARGVQARATDPDGDGVLNITRAELLGAQQRASMGNVLLLGGAAVAAGSGLWILLAPVKSGSGSSGEPETPITVQLGGAL
jgi:hypothetical protein